MSPPLVTIGTVGLLFLGAMFFGVADSTGTAESKTFVAGVPWAVWRMLAAAAMLLFLGLMVTAIQVLAGSAGWGIDASARRQLVYLAIAILAAGALIALRFSLHGGDPDLPVRGLWVRTRVILVTGLLASIPWLTMVWLAHDSCRTLRERTRSMPPVSELPDSDEPGPFRVVIVQLLELWRLLVLCVGAFALGVIAAIVTSSALRAAFIDAHPDRADEMPAVNVVYYGAVFAVLLSILAVPLAAAWRATARQVVDRAYPLPPDGQPTDEWIAARSRMEGLLHLDVSFLRNPLTALSVFAPLLTSVVAAFLPQIGN